MPGSCDVFCKKTHGRWQNLWHLLRVVWIWKATGQIAISLVLEARTAVPLQRYTKDVWRRWTYLYVEALKDLGGCDKKLFLQSLLVFSWNLTPVHAKARASARGTVRALSDFWQLRLKIMLRYWMLRMMYLRVGRGSRVDRFFNVPCNLLSCRLNLYLLAVAGCVTTWKVHVYQEGSVYSNKPNMLRMPYAVCRMPMNLRNFFSAPGTKMILPSNPCNNPQIAAQKAERMRWDIMQKHMRRKPSARMFVSENMRICQHELIYKWLL